MCWPFVLEECGPELKYIKGERNVVTYALSHLDIEHAREIFNIAKCFGFNDDDLHAAPHSQFDIATLPK
jgi:hypothetical protein